MKRILFILFILTPFLLHGQISERLNKQFPDSVRAYDFSNISYPEGVRILKYASSANNLSLPDYQEIDKKCAALVSIGRTLGSKEKDIKRNDHIIYYWSFRAGDSSNQTTQPLDLMAKYNRLTLDIIGKDSKEYPIQIARYHLVSGNLLREKGNFANAYNELNKSIVIYKNNYAYDGLLQSFSSITQLYFSLELFSPAIAYNDSTLLYLKKAQKSESRLYKLTDPSFLIAKKAVLYLNKWFFEKKTKKDEKSIIQLCELLVKNPSNTKEVRAHAYSTLFRLLYYKRDFSKSLIYIDSTLSLTADSPNVAERAVFEMYKGLVLVHLGKKKDGMMLIRRNQVQMVSSTEERHFLEELYLFEKQKGNFNKALIYHEALLKLRQASQVNKHRGQIFEIQQKYNLNEKDLSIQKLNEEKTRNKLYAGGAGLFVCFAGLIVGIRIKGNQKRTRTLVAQMEELTELHILRIEEEKESERKRLGQTLHDDLAGTLAASIRFLRMRAEEDSRDKLWLSDISDMLENSYDIARGRSHELYFEKESASFWKRLYDNIDLFFLGTDMKVTLTCEPCEALLTPEIKTTMLLFLKEAITNIIKHAKASEVEIIIYEDLEKLILEVGDNGKGILTKSMSANVGLKSLHERAISLNGDFIISAGKSAGTNVKLIIPISIGQKN